MGSSSGGFCREPFAAQISPQKIFSESGNSSANFFSAAMNQTILEIWLLWAEVMAVERASCTLEIAVARLMGTEFSLRATEGN